MKYGKWQPANYDQIYRGPVTLADALADSINTIACTAHCRGGPGQDCGNRQTARNWIKACNHASLALGTSELSLLELTAAYAPFANGGVRARPYLINQITTSTGKLLYKRKPARPIQVIEPHALA